MSNFVVVPQFGGQPAPMSATDTSQRFELGFEVWARDMGQTNAAGTTTPTATASGLGGGVFRYCQGSNISSAGQIVYIASNQAIRLSGAQPNPVGIAAGPLSATNVFGWVQLQGLCDYGRLSDTAIGANVAIFVGAAGYPVAASAANSRLMGIVCYSSYTGVGGSLSGSYELNRPYVQFNTGSM